MLVFFVYLKTLQKHVELSYLFQGEIYPLWFIIKGDLEVEYIQIPNGTKRPEELANSYRHFIPNLIMILIIKFQR